MTDTAQPPDSLFTFIYCYDLLTLTGVGEPPRTLGRRLLVSDFTPPKGPTALGFTSSPVRKSDSRIVWKEDVENVRGLESNILGRDDLGGESLTKAILITNS